MLIAVCAMIVAVCVLFSRKGTGQDEQSVVQQSDKPHMPTSFTNANYCANVGKLARGEPFKQRNRTMRFLELATRFLSKESQLALQKVIDEGVDKQPDSFAKLSVKYMDLIGYLRSEGKLSAYYELLKEVFEKNPNDINTLRMLAAVASIPSMNKHDEYEYYLSKLAAIDTSEDVMFPYAKVMLEKGKPRYAYSLVLRTLAEHPEQMSEMLTNTLWLFDKYKAKNERNLIVNELMGIDNIDPFRASRCGDVLFKAGEFDDARYFYEKCCDNSSASDFLRELSTVRLCTTEVVRGNWNQETVERLNLLSKSASTPAVRHEAIKALSRIGVDPLMQHPNSNNQKTTEEE